MNALQRMERYWKEVIQVSTPENDSVFMIARTKFSWIGPFVATRKSEHI